VTDLAPPPAAPVTGPASPAPAGPPEASPTGPTPFDDAGTDPFEPIRPAVRIRGLRKQYGSVAAVDGLDLDVPAGSVFGLVGPNGAGKTTTMLSVVTLLVPDAGTVEVHGHDALADPAAVRSVVGYMPDFFGLYDGMSCSEYLDYFAAAHGLAPERATAQVTDLLELVGLDHKADVDVSGLSRGMQQRLSLARALVHDPAVLVLDEPASGLDPRARVDLREILLALGEMDRTIIVSSHILAELEEICDRVAIVEAGRVLASGTPADIRTGVTGATTVRVRLHVGADTAAEAMARAVAVAATAGGVHVGSRDTSLRFEVVGGEPAVVDLLSALVADGLRVIEFREEAGGLERLFMDVTRGVIR